MKRLLLAAPTRPELEHLEHLLSALAGTSTPTKGWPWGEWHIHTHHSGPGVPMVLLHLSQALQHYRPELLVHVGIAGARRGSADIGETVEILSDRYADIGAEDRDGQFLDMFCLGLWTESDADWTMGRFHQPRSWKLPGLKKLDAVTVHSIPGSSARIRDLERRHPFQIESMEGAAVFHLASHLQIPFLALRGISNFLEPRNREAWDIPGALATLSRHTLSFLESLNQVQFDAVSNPGT
jgi:futalosine hydrolase